MDGQHPCPLDLATHWGKAEQSGEHSSATKFGAAGDILSMVYVYLATFVGFALGIQGDRQGLINKSSQPPFFLEDIISRVL